MDNPVSIHEELKQLRKWPSVDVSSDEEVYARIVTAAGVPFQWSGTANATVITEAFMRELDPQLVKREEARLTFTDGSLVVEIIGYDLMHQAWLARRING